MRTTPEIENIEDWLIREALGQPDIGAMFAGTCVLSLFFAGH